MMKEDTKPCPSCQEPIPRKNFRAVVIKCTSCKIPHCDQCRIFDVCVDCYIKAHGTNEYWGYMSDKYIGVA